MRPNYTIPRLYMDQSLEGQIELSREQAHYFGTVLRKSLGDQVRLFNARDGEWSAEIVDCARKSMRLDILEKLRNPEPVPDIRLLFAPLRKHRTATVLEKATELGVRTLQPVLTQHTQFAKFNAERARLQVIEAAEQTERLDLPDIYDLISLERALSDDRALIFADEAGGEPVLDVLKRVTLPLDILIGPEGGFTNEERAMISARKGCATITLGPRILRADTAAISLLSLVQATIGDWN